MTSGTQTITGFTTEFKLTSGDIPPPLVGASTTVVNNRLYVFGGRLVSSRQMTNHLYFLDLDALVWTRHIAEPDSPPPPRPRYFHSTNHYGKYLVVFGGMSYSTKRSSQSLCALDDICLFDLDLMVWKYPEVQPSLYTPQARYAHLSVFAEDKLVIIGGQDMSNQYINEINVYCMTTCSWVSGGPVSKQYGAYRSIAFYPSSIHRNSMPASPFWADGSDSDTPVVCIYSNYNFTDVTRDLESFSAIPPAAEFKNHSAEMSGFSLPPGLRFPSGHVLGHHMILTGTYLTPTYKAFNIWALNLANLVWVKIDPGSVLAQGSWNKGVLYEKKRQLVILGDRGRDLLEDYSHRQTNFNHVAVMDLEAFGIYTFPEETCAPVAQELGLSMLSEPSMADMEIITEDNRSIPVNSNVMLLRWPRFTEVLAEKEHAASGFKRLLFPENYPVTLAFLQFIYTDHLVTAQQYQPQILVRLLLLSEIYNIPRLGELSTHALHQALTINTASMIYEAAVLTGKTALQIRALRVLFNTKKKMMQQQQQQQQQQHQHQQQQYGELPLSPTILDSPSVFPIHYSTTSPQPTSPVGQRRSNEEDGFPLRPTPPVSSSTVRRMAASKSSTTVSPDSNYFYSIPAPKLSKSSTLYHASQKVPSSAVERPRKASLSPYSNPYGQNSSGPMSPTYDKPHSSFKF
ncbi:hypothetical protein CU097_013335 [Rhizopus azygosporus]|uniref:BTB domain-containing protein n=1 Tax=Rhizopus azygosporus TaxID=86630 RepID=A0A367JWJ3_RHIAZ|nr:hypothetical protein CU097_013335 [Rhizopus azygosporus]